MKRGGSRVIVSSMLGVCLTWMGCQPLTSSRYSEEKEANFVSGKKKLFYDKKGALLAFEKAAEVNPRSASAHKELGILYYQDFTNYPSAIYHFQKLLHLRPDDPHADQISQHVLACKLEIAKEVELPPGDKKLKMHFTRLLRSNLDLTNEVHQLKIQVSQLKGVLRAQQGQVARERTTTTPTTVAPREVRSPQIPTGQSAVPRAIAPPVNIARAPVVQLGGTHAIQENDTFFSLSQLYGVSVAELEAANPNVLPTRLQINDLVNIPLASNSRTSARQ